MSKGQAGSRPWRALETLIRSLNFSLKAQGSHWKVVRMGGLEAWSDFVLSISLWLLCGKWTLWGLKFALRDSRRIVQKPRGETMVAWEQRKCRKFGRREGKIDGELERAREPYREKGGEGRAEWSGEEGREEEMEMF